LPVERDATPDHGIENPNDLRGQLYTASSYEEFDELKRRYRKAVEQSLLTPTGTDADVVDAQRRHVGNFLLQHLVDIELEISLSRDRHPFSSSDRSVNIPNICKLAATWLDLQTADRGGRHARRRR
jgi:hypothetical protein